MFEVIQLFEDTVEEISIKISSGLSESFRIENILLGDIMIKNPLSLNFDLKSVKNEGINE